MDIESNAAPLLPSELPIAIQNREAAASTLTMGDLYLDALNKCTMVAFSSGGGACQVRSFKKEECNA